MIHQIIKPRKENTKTDISNGKTTKSNGTEIK